MRLEMNFANFYSTRGPTKKVKERKKRTEYKIVIEPQREEEDPIPSIAVWGSILFAVGIEVRFMVAGFDYSEGDPRKPGISWMGSERCSKALEEEIVALAIDELRGSVYCLNPQCKEKVYPGTSLCDNGCDDLECPLCGHFSMSHDHIIFCTRGCKLPWREDGGLDTDEVEDILHRRSERRRKYAEKKAERRRDGGDGTARPEGDRVSGGSGAEAL